MWLAQSEFPGKEADLPSELLALKRDGLEIDWCENLGSYKKLIPALKKYSDVLICTADDDIAYPTDWLRQLLSSYVQHPNELNALRCHKITFDHNLHGV